MIPETLRKMNAFSSNNYPAVLGTGYGKQLPHYNGGWAYVSGAGISYESELVTNTNTYPSDKKILSAFEPITLLSQQIDINFSYYPDPENSPGLYFDNLYSDPNYKCYIFPVYYFYHYGKGEIVGNHAAKTFHLRVHQANAQHIINAYIDKPISMENIGVVNRAYIYNTIGDTLRIKLFVPNAWCNTSAGHSGYPLQQYGGIQVSSVSVRGGYTDSISLNNDTIYNTISIKNDGGLSIEYYWMFENISLNNTFEPDIFRSYDSNYTKMFNLKLIINVNGEEYNESFSS